MERLYSFVTSRLPFLTLPERYVKINEETLFLFLWIKVLSSEMDLDVSFDGSVLNGGLCPHPGSDF